MKQNNIIKLVLLLVLYSVFATAKTNWAPIIMGDITTFAPYAKTNTLQTLKDVYKPNDVVGVKVDAALSGDQDWVGVYHKNASTAWDNVVAWNWVPHNGIFALSTIKKTMPVGAYEARLFFHNNVQQKASYPFTVALSNFQTTKAKYAPNETVSVTVNVPLSGDKDWVGIFPKNTDNSWGNVVAWNWITKKGTVDLTKDNKPMPAGKYEARLFWHNAYGADVEAKQTFGFSVENKGGANFGTIGQFNVKSKIDPNNANMKFHYSQNHTNNAPIVIFCSPSKKLYYNYLMEFIASQGYFVVEATQDNNPPDYVSMMQNIKNEYHVDTSKVVLMGYSRGSSYIYETLKALKSHNYAKAKSGLVSLDGFFANKMKTNDMAALDTEVLLMMFGGVDGTTHGRDQKRSYQDPRIFLTLFNMLKGNNEVSLYPVDANDNHGYLGKGNANSLEAYINNRQDVIKPMHAFLHHILTYTTGVDHGGDIVMIGDAKYNEVKAHLLDYKDDNSYLYKCKTIYFNGLNYCDPHHPLFDVKN